MNKSNKELERLGIKILNMARTELYLAMRYLYPALDRLTPTSDMRVKFLATDGSRLYFMPLFTVKKYKENPVSINRAYLHSVLHCLFGHFHRHEGRREDLWSLACDIMVEGIIDKLEFSCVETVIPPLKEDTEERILKKVKLFSAEYIYDYLVSEKTDIVLLESLFAVDEHDFWEKDEKTDEKKDEKKENNEKNRELWNEAGKKIQTELETYSKSVGLERTLLYQSLVFENREKTSYDEFLRKFKRPHEEIKIDFESFDYGFYNYGLRLYGNMPLIEEPEYKISEKIKNFVIAIDTSGSVSKETVSGFLRETVNVLTEGNGFNEFIIKCIIIQCDNQVQEVKTVSGKEELDAYISGFKITGRGGTDFRPVFKYIEDEMEKKNIDEVSGMIYFTDGYGIYPKTRQGYEVAFVFPETAYADEKLPFEAESFPVWAMHLTVKERKD